MKRITFLPLSLLFLSNIAFGQYYIGNTPEEIIGEIQGKATMIMKNYNESRELILSWIENGDTKYAVYFSGETSYKTYIIPLSDRTLIQWYRVINSSLPKAAGKESVWISYTKTGTFQLRLIYYPGRVVKCFEVTKTDEY